MTGWRATGGHLESVVEKDLDADEAEDSRSNAEGKEPKVTHRIGFEQISLKLSRSLNVRSEKRCETDSSSVTVPQCNWYCYIMVY